MAWAAGLRFTRYVDDVCLSGGEHTRRFAASLERLVAKHRFKSGFRKRHDWGPGERKTVTGIVVNTKPNVLEEYRRTIHKILIQHLNGSAVLTDLELRSLRGKVGYVSFVNPVAGRKLQSLLE